MAHSVGHRRSGLVDHRGVSLAVRKVRVASGLVHFSVTWSGQAPAVLWCNLATYKTGEIQPMSVPVTCEACNRATLVEILRTVV